MVLRTRKATILIDIHGKVYTCLTSLCVSMSVWRHCVCLCLFDAAVYVYVCLTSLCVSMWRRCVCLCLFDVAVCVYVCLTSLCMSMSVWRLAGRWEVQWWGVVARQIIEIVVICLLRLISHLANLLVLGVWHNLTLMRYRLHIVLIFMWRFI